MKHTMKKNKEYRNNLGKFLTFENDTLTRETLLCVTYAH